MPSRARVGGSDGAKSNRFLAFPPAAPDAEPKYLSHPAKGQLPALVFEGQEGLSPSSGGKLPEEPEDDVSKIPKFHTSAHVLCFSSARKVGKQRAHKFL